MERKKIELKKNVFLSHVPRMDYFLKVQLFNEFPSIMVKKKQNKVFSFYHLCTRKKDT